MFSEYSTGMVHKMNDTATKQNYLFSNAELRNLILPLILEQTLVITVGMVDTMMVSSVGEAAVSGVSLVDMLVNLVFSVFAALATGGSVVTSQYLGAGKTKDACNSSRQLIVTSAVFALGVMAVCMAACRPILSFFFGSIEADVMQNAQLYLLISALSFPFMGIYGAASALFRAMGNSMIVLKSSCIMNIINVVGNAIGIFVLHMGVLGVAIPSLLSRIVAAAILYLLLRRPVYEVHLNRGKFHFDGKVIRTLLYIGIPSGIESGIFQLGRVAVVSIISGFGTVQIAANGVANSLDSMGCIMGQAMSLAMITVIGQCVGAASLAQVKYYTKKLMLITYAGMIVINVAILLSLPVILKLYGLSPETTALAGELVWIHDGIAMFLWPISFVLPNMMRACNDVRYTMVISIFSMVVFRIGLSLVMGVNMGMGAVGVWWAMIVDWIFRSSCFVGRYLKGTWRKFCVLK